MEEGLKENNGENQGPYRATKLWNNVVLEFKKNMPTGRHRRNMRVFEDCFIASHGVDWLHDHLLKNNDFGENVTRFQTIQLLQKFQKSEVFEDVRSVKRKELFQDNGRLYRFIIGFNSPKKRKPLKNTVNTESSSTVLTPSTPRKPKESLKFPLKETEIHSKSVPFQPCQLVQKSLTREQTEKVWRTVALAKLQKLLGKIGISNLIDVHDIEPRFIIHNATHMSRNGMVTNIQKEEHLPQWIISAMRCLAHWPDAVDESLPSYPGFEMDVFSVVKDHFQNLDEPLITYQLYEVFYNMFMHADSKAMRRSTPRHLMGMGRDSFLSMENLITHLTSPRPLSNLNLSCIANIDGHNRMDQSFSLNQLFNESEPSIHETMYITARDESYYDNFAFEGSDKSGPSLRRFYSSSNVNDAEQYLRNGQDNIASHASGTVKPPQYRDPPPYTKLKLVGRTLSTAIKSKSLQRTSSYEETFNKTEQTIAKSKDRMIEILQICCLFLPPANRRKLHLLLRLMYKMIHNERLSLGNGVSMRSTVLETFHRSVLLCIDESCYEDQVGLQMTAFLMDNHEKIMVVPQRLKESVEMRIAEMQRIQIRYGPISPQEVTFTQRVSVQQYEKQKLTNSEEALVDLLDTILKNEKMTEKEKRKRVKQFQKVYPDIYRKRFPEEVGEEKSKKHLLLGMTGALTKLKAMRF